MLHGQGSCKKEWLSLAPCKTLHDNSVCTATRWCPNTALQACVHGKIETCLRCVESEAPGVEPGNLYLQNAFQGILIDAQSVLGLRSPPRHTAHRVVPGQSDRAGTPE